MAAGLRISSAIFIVFAFLITIVRKISNCNFSSADLWDFAEDYKFPRESLNLRRGNQLQSSIESDSDHSTICLVCEAKHGNCLRELLALLEQFKIREPSDSELMNTKEQFKLGINLGNLRMIAFEEALEKTKPFLNAYVQINRYHLYYKVNSTFLSDISD